MGISPNLFQQLKKNREGETLVKGENVFDIFYRTKGKILLSPKNYLFCF